MLNFARKLASQGAVWPSIDYELADIRSRGFLRGTVLNAGCGWRDISHIVDGTLVNLDITWPGDTRTNVDITAPLHDIPRPENSFDAVACIAVLEHVENPEEVTAEMFRVLKPGGRLIASVPFLQPEHKVPTDFQRYTRDGLSSLLTRHGFEVEEVKPLFTVYHTLHWIVYEWLHINNSFLYKLLRVLLLPALVVLARKSGTVSDKVASAFRIIGRKPTVTP